MTNLTAAERPVRACLRRLGMLLVPAACLAVLPENASAQGFPNVSRTPGELLAGPIAPEQGRTAIIAWHGERIVTVPEPPGSQPGADVHMRVIDINDPYNPVVTVLPDQTGGFNSHGYYKYGPYLYVGNHCLDFNNQPCNGSNNIWTNALVIGGARTAPIGTSQLTRASMEGDAGIPMGTYGRAGAQSPWGARHWWSYGNVEGEAWLGVRRSMSEWVHDWGNGGAPTGPAVTATWDHLGETGVIGMPFIMGNILIYASDQTGTGVATYDISDPSNPVLLDVLKEENPGGYWPEVYGHYVFFPRRDGEGGAGSDAGFMVVDFSDPTDLRVAADRNLPGSNQYVTFQDEYAFMNNYKIDMRTFEPVLELATNGTTLDASQFALPVGNLVITGGYGSSGPGVAIWAHQAEPDTRSPFVLYHVPRPDQANYSTECPITLSIPETLKTETIVDGVSLIVQPVGGSPVETWHSFGQNKLLTVTPRQQLQPDTTYEVILTSDIEDAAGNGLEPYSFRFSTGSNLAGGNYPPQVDSITATPEVAVPGTQVALSWTGSDQDMDPVEYRVDYGDGTPRSAWGAATSINHTYAEAGHYQVTVQARDPLGSVAALSRKITVVDPPAAPGSTASSIIAANAAGTVLFNANPDVDTVTAVDAETLQPVWEATVGETPRGLAVAADGTVWVVCRDSDEIHVLNAADGTNSQTLALPYGSRPVAIAPVPGGSEMLVSCEGDELLRRFDTASRAENASLPLGPYPRAIAVTQDGSRTLVTRFISGEHTGSVYDVSLAGGMSLTRTITLTRDRTEDGSATSRGVPNYLAGIRIAPNGDYAWVVGKKDNTTRGAFFSPTLPLGQDNTVRAMLMLIDLNTNSEDVSLRLDIDNSDSPTAVDFSPLGNYAYISLQGNAQIAVIDVLEFMRQTTPGTVHSRWGTGIAPQGVIVDGARSHIIASDFMDRTMTVLDAEAFLSSGSGTVPITTVDLVGREKLHPQVLAGKRIFYHASDPRMSAEGYISCATCHIDGGHDGRTWDFTNRGEGFRNTTDLRGRSGTWHGNVHWSANFDEIHDFENDIRNDFGGRGFLTDTQFASVSDTLGTPKAGLSEDLDALAAYVASLGVTSLPRSPHREPDGTLSAAALRGRDLFNAHNCASCHTPNNDYTDRVMHDVGTLKDSSGSRLGGPLNAIDTPTLLGLHDAAPYLHDGSAESLGDVFRIAGGTMLQAEDGATNGSANAQDVNWMSMKEWHNSMFVDFDNGGTLTFAGITSSTGGDGFIEIRYNSGYNSSGISIGVNGNSTSVTAPQTPNEPGWRANEWRKLRVPVTWQAGSNSVVFTQNNGGQFRIDDVLFTTPDDLTAADAHVRGFTDPEIEDLVAYLLSLDGGNAAAPDLLVEDSGGNAISDALPDLVAFATPTDPITVEYTIQNTGAGPLNIGQFHIDGPAAPFVSISAHSAPTLLPGQSTTLRLTVQPGAEDSEAALSAWTDAASMNNNLGWTVRFSPATTSVRDWAVLE